MRNKIKKSLKFIGILIAFILVLITGLIFSLQIPSVQNFVKNKLISYLEKKIDTEVSLEKIYVSFPNDIVLNNFYLKGKDVDTLLFVDKLNVGIYLPDLIKSTANVSKIDLDGVVANVNRTEEGVFNFQFILDAFAFASEDEDETDSKPFKIDLDKIQLKNISLNYNDNSSKLFVNLNLNEFKTEVDKFDLQENDYAIKSILIDGFKFKFNQEIVDKIIATNSQEKDSLSVDKPLKINLSNIELKNFDVSYSDEASRMNAQVVFSTFKTKINKIDLVKNLYEVDKIDLNNAKINFDMFSETVDNKVQEKDINVDETNGLSFLLNELNFNDIAVVFNNNAVKKTNNGIDFNHLNFNEINLKLKNFIFNDSQISGSISNTNVNENSGLLIKKLETNFNYGEKSAFLKNLILETEKSIIRDEVILDYNKQSDLTENLESVSIFANLPKTKIALSDILLLVPDLKNTPPFNEFSNSILEIDSRLKGKVENLNLEKLIVSGLGNIKINANGIIKNATNVDKLWVDIKVNDFSIHDSDLNKILPKQTIPDNIQLPSTLSIKGNAKGSMNDILADLQMKSSFGDADLKAVLNQKIKNKETYILTANVNHFNVGKLIKNDSIGHVSASLKVSGKSFDLEKAQAVISANVSSANYNSYTYKDLNLNGKINDGDYDVTLKMNDPNVIFDINAIGKYTEKQPTLKLKGDITKIDFYKTGFSDETLALAGEITADFTNLNPDYLNGNLKLHDFAVAYKTGLYPISDVQLVALSNETENQINFDSQIFNILISGKYKLTEIATHLQRTINNYYNLNLSDEVLNQKLEPAYFNVDVVLKNDNVLTKFLPKLDKFNNIQLKGIYESETNKINIQSKISQIIYGENIINEFDFNVANNQEHLDFNLSVDGIESESFTLEKTSLTGKIKDNNIAYDFKIHDEFDKIQYEIAGSVSSINEVLQIALDNNGLKLNYEDWKVNPDNYIQISEKGILANQFEISNDQSKILIDSKNKVPNSPLNINISNFTIETITEMIKKDSLLASGIVNGTAQIHDLKNKMTFISDINIQKLNVFGSNVGNLSLKVDNESDERLSANVQLTGYDNEVSVNGYYDTKLEKFDLNVLISKLQMKSLQGFSLQMISDAKGFLTGNLNITGNVEKPSILGNIKFNEASLHVNNLNANFTKINDEITFKKTGINLNQFKINDSDGNTLTINGDILTQAYRDFKFNLDIFGTNFKVVNSPNADDNMLYGVASLDVNLSVKGNMNLPKVSGNLKVTSETDFTFVMPQYSPALQEREGIIEFIDQDQLVLEETIDEDEEETNSEIKGLDVSVNIEVDKNAKIAIVLDKINNDIVRIQGEAQLTGGIDPSGKTTLVGTYEVQQGSYDMSVNVLKRKFEIEKGSTITWTGEPMKADVDITAVYKIKAAPLDLVQQQLNSGSTQDMNLYKQKLPFQTLLIMKGELLKPQITFNIQLDEDNSNVSNEVITTVNSKLEQLRNEESELNKQVFALLLLNRFIGENPFETNVNVSAATMARQSVSNLLSQQLNNLASELIKGVDINFDLESTDDYTSGSKATRTDLNIGVTKSLFHDRLKVTVGSNFGLEGEGRENEQTNNIAGDVSVEYMLSKNGRYMLKAYRINEYQVALQGEVVETGLGFIITLDYNKFKDIIKSKKQNKNSETNKTKKDN